MRQSDFIQIKLPKMTKFKSKNKDDSPYYLFHTWVAQNSGVDIPEEAFGINVSASWLCKKDYDALSKLVKEWLKTKHKLTGKALERTFGYHMLEVSPAAWDNDNRPEWAFPGNVYVNEHRLIITKGI